VGRRKSGGQRESQSRVRERRGVITGGKGLRALIAAINEGERNSKREFNAERENFGQIRDPLWSGIYNHWCSQVALQIKFLNKISYLLLLLCIYYFPYYKSKPS
jgi:hypothetical protein